jgi:cytochrome c oxidase cbb3-type subunit 4
MDINDLRGFTTLATMLTFLGICWWAYRSRNRQRFEDDAMLPFRDEAHDPREDAEATER